jgi:hypothetical protein
LWWVLNERFGTNFTPAGQLWFDRVMETVARDGELGDQARTNSEDQFKLVFDPKAQAAVPARVERNEAIANTLLTDERIRAVALDLMMRAVFGRLREGGTVEGNRDGQYLGTVGSTSADQASMPPASDATCGNPASLSSAAPDRLRMPWWQYTTTSAPSGGRTSSSRRPSSPSGINVLSGSAARANSSGWRTSRR